MAPWGVGTSLQGESQIRVLQITHNFHFFAYQVFETFGTNYYPKVLFCKVHSFRFDTGNHGENLDLARESQIEKSLGTTDVSNCQRLHLLQHFKK